MFGKDKKKEKNDNKPDKEKGSASAGDEEAKEMTLSLKEYEELKKDKEEKDSFSDKYVRLYADYENSRRIWEKQKQELLKFGNFRILKDFAVVLDELEAALLSLKDKSAEEVKGLKMIYTKIKDLLLKEGLNQVEAVGKAFDPHLHEALCFEERDDLEEHSVIEVIQQGYRYGDKLLRPAKVKVSVKPKKAEENDKTDGPDSKDAENNGKIDSPDNSDKSDGENKNQDSKGKE